MSLRTSPIRSSMKITSKKKMSLPRLSGLNVHYTGEKRNLETLNSDTSEAQRLAKIDFHNRNKTVRAFFKDYDFEIVEGERQKLIEEAKKKISKDSTLKEIEKNKENRIKNMKKKRREGKLFVNEFWSKDYYKKVMKYTKLHTIINFVQKEKWRSLLARDTMKKNGRQYMYIPNNLFVESFSKIFRAKSQNDYEEEDMSMFLKYCPYNLRNKVRKEKDKKPSLALSPNRVSRRKMSSYVYSARNSSLELNSIPELEISKKPKPISITQRRHNQESNKQDFSSCDRLLGDCNKLMEEEREIKE